jgi:hypothetical protein
MRSSTTPVSEPCGAAESRWRWAPLPLGFQPPQKHSHELSGRLFDYVGAALEEHGDARSARHHVASAQAETASASAR